MLTETAATEAAIKKLLNQSNSPSIVHLSTHGFFYPNIKKEQDNMLSLSQEKNVFKYSEDPMIRAGLLLAGANETWGKDIAPSSSEDGILTAKEISNLNLRNTELVVLSACETGLGEINGSEGVYGLQRAFKMAGAKNLLMSLWKVPDEATQELMTAFYTNWLSEKMTLHDAFQTAQQTMRAKYADPYMWAGFILIE